MMGGEKTPGEEDERTCNRKEEEEFQSTPSAALLSKPNVIRSFILFVCVVFSMHNKIALK